MVIEGPEETKNSELSTTCVKINIIQDPSFHSRANWKSSLLSFNTLIACNAIRKKAYIVCNGQQVQIQHANTEMYTVIWYTLN
jgi:hypothetical protein